MTKRTFIASLVGVPATMGQPGDATAVVFVGMPKRRSMNQIGNDVSGTLDERESQEYMCMITRKGGRYFWPTRENKEVRRTVSGDFVIFNALDGSGYVKILTKFALPIDYMEHVHDKLFTVTYWGEKSVFRDAEATSSR